MEGAWLWTLLTAAFYLLNSLFSHEKFKNCLEFLTHGHITTLACLSLIAAQYVTFINTSKINWSQPQSTCRGRVEIGGVYLPSAGAYTMYVMVDIVKEVGVPH
jgi:hypothetical protein